MSKMSDRTFGIELEIVGLSEEGAFLALRHAGIPVNDPQYWRAKHNNIWNITEDGSLDSPDGRTAEVVSPILHGSEGLKQVRKVCQALEAFGAEVNKTCGLHVHVGAKELTPGEVVKIITRYAEHEDFINRLVHPSRRKSAPFCSSMKPYVSKLDPELMVEEKKEIKHLQAAIDVCPICDNSCCRTCRMRKKQIRGLRNKIDSGVKFATVEEIAALVDDRYTNINIQAYCKHGTLEFRQHNGSINATKVVNWIQFVLNFVEQSRALTPHKKKKTDVGNRRYRAVCAALKAAGNRGLTTSQMARVGGWKTSGVPQAVGRLAKTMQCTIKVFDRRYRLVRTPCRSKDNGPLMGLPSHLKAYFLDRSRILQNDFKTWA